MDHNLELRRLDEGASESVQDERRARILDAAERCFVRAGFHRITMQDDAEREVGHRLALTEAAFAGLIPLGSVM